ncbi:MAG: metal-dependent transcriptional regulator [Actinomycetota bacterium]
MVTETMSATDAGIAVSAPSVSAPVASTSPLTEPVEPSTVGGHRVAAVATEVLEVLLEHDERGTVASGAELARRIPVADAAVDAAVTALLSQGTAVVAGDVVALSDAGRDHATRAVRRHRLTERLLCDVIGLEWWKVHHEAERWEGLVSDELEARLLDLLDDPGTCPHGNPIPGSGNRPDQRHEVVLAEAATGPVRVLRITETLEGDDEALQLLQNCGFLPGRDAEVQRVEGGWVQVAGSVRDAALPPHVAAHTYVEPI